MRINTPAAKMVANTRTSVTGRLRDVFRNERGAVDLPSIMVGAIVLGLLTAAILATVFTVIPWAQNNAAKQMVSQIVSSQSAYYAMSADGSDPRYATLAQLKSSKFLTESTDANKVKVNYRNATASSVGGVVVGDTHPSGVPTIVTSGDAFVVSVQSDTGAVFYASHDAPQPSQV